MTPSCLSTDESGRHGAPVPTAARQTPPAFQRSHLAWLALAYFTIATLSLPFAISPEYAAPLWPAAGLALCALLAWGWRCWPGVWLGSFAANLLHQTVISGNEATPALVTLLALVAAGASLQAVVGARLVMPFVTAIDPLCRLRDAVSYLILGGPMACLLSATIGVAGLYRVYGLSSDAAVSQWVVWWAGDSLGVLLFAPLVLLVLAESGPQFRTDVLRIALPLLVTGVMVVAGYLWHNIHDQADHREKSAARADDLHRNLKTVLAGSIGGVRALASLFDAREKVTLAEFGTFGRGVLGWAGMQSLAWIPRVPRAEREAVEAAMQRDGLRDFVFRDYGSGDRQLVPAGERAEYYPALYIVALRGDAAVSGLDAGAQAASRAALQQAMDSAQPVLVSREVFYDQDIIGVSEWAVYVPVYRVGFDARPASLEARRIALRGFAAGTISIDQIVDFSIGHNGPQRLAFRLSSLSDSGPARLLLASAVPAARAARPELSYHIEGLIGDRLLLEMWDIAPWQPGQSATGRFYLFSSVLFTLLASVFTLVAAGQSVRIRREVSSRTAELRDSEQRIRSILDNTTAFIGKLTPDGVLVDVNRAGLKAFGRSRDEVIGRPLEDTYWFSYSAPVRARLRNATQRARNGETVRYDVEARVGENSFISVDFMLAAACDAGGRVLALVWSGIDVSEQKQIELAMREATAQLQALSRKLVDAQEAERRHLAAELHDRVGQNLTALSINIAVVMRGIQNEEESIICRLRDSAALIESTSAHIDGVLDDLRPPILEALGLQSALRWYGEAFQRRTEIPVNVSSRGLSRRLSLQQETALFRIIQEALNNVVKHAMASMVELRFDWQAGSVSLEIADDGIGFELTPRDQIGGLGIVNMRERAQAIGGSMEIDSRPGGGTRITVKVKY